MPAPTDLLSIHAATRGDSPAVLVDHGAGSTPTVTTFAELEAMCNRAARAFRTLGAQPGERLAWCGPNSLSVLATIHASRKAGQISVPLSYRFTADEMQYVVDNAEATIVVIDAEQAPLIASVRDRLPSVKAVVVFDGDVPDGCVGWDDVTAVESPEAPEVPPSFGSAMVYTSGTTGKPKGAVRTSTDTETMAALLGLLALRPGDEVHLTTGPLYHSGPLAFGIIAHQLGTPVVVMRKFDARDWLRLVEEQRVTNTFSAPTQLKRIVSLPDDVLAAADVSSMRCLIANAAPVPYALKQEVVAKLGDGFLYEVYGSTELGIATVLLPADQLRKPGSCGRTYGPVEVRIVRDDGTDADTGEPGELFIASRLAIDGYHRTDEKLTELGTSGWKSVGDVAYLDDEGFLHICDRKKDMIISGGVNIYPAEIEAVLHGHPSILDVAVFGIPDEEWGESVYAVLQPHAGTTVDLDDVRAFADERLAAYKRPRGYEVRDELPRTEAGKLLKRMLRDEFWRDRTSKV